MAQNICPQCGAPLPPGATQCKYCGEVIAQPQQQQQQQSPQQPVYAQPVYYAPNSAYMDGINPQ